MAWLFKLPHYHWLVVFGLCGFFAIALAFSSYNLFHLSMANFNFLKAYGVEAIRLGALFQLVQILIGSVFALLCYLGFKMCEAELLSRYNEWKRK